MYFVNINNNVSMPVFVGQIQNEYMYSGEGPYSHGLTQIRRELKILGLGTFFR